MESGAKQGIVINGQAEERGQETEGQGDMGTRGSRIGSVHPTAYPPANLPRSMPHVLHPKSRIYLYCLFRGPASLCPQRGMDGPNATVVVSYKGLCALVSSVSIDSEQTLNERLKDMEWLIPMVKRHEEIVRYVMAAHPVIPIRFGTIYKDTERVLSVMRDGYGRLCSHLDFIRDKEEWGVKVYAGEGAGRKAMAASSKVIGQFEKKMASASSGQAYLLRKKKDDLIRQQSIDFLNSLSNALYQEMLSWSIEGKRNKVLGKRSTGKKSNMMLNAAFLLNKLDVRAFKEKVDALAANYKSDGLSFEMSGPWPCYNFCPDFDM